MPNQTKSAFWFEDNLAEHEQLPPLQAPYLLHRVENDDEIQDNTVSHIHQNYAIADLDNSRILTYPVDSNEIFQKGLLSLPCGHERIPELMDEGHSRLLTSENHLQSDAELPTSHRSNSTDSDIHGGLKITDKDLEWSNDEKQDESSDSEIPEGFIITAADIEWSEGRNESDDSDSDIAEELKITDKDFEWSDGDKQEDKIKGRKRKAGHDDRNQGEPPKRKLYSCNTDDKPFACDDCDFKTRYRSYLKIHGRIHTGHRFVGEKLYSCEECSYQSATSGSLRRHRRIHLRKGKNTE